MDSYQKVLKSICRVCLSHSSYQNMVSLFDSTSEDGLSCYGKFVVTFANIKLVTDHNLPIMMCKNCLTLLKQAILFKYKCENSDLQLQNLIRTNDSTNYNHKELICQYTIFKHYFPEECVPTTRNSKINGEMKFNSIEKTDETILQQNKVESKISLPHDDDDDSCNSDWSQESLNTFPVTQNTDTDSKFYKSCSNLDDDKIQKSHINSGDVLLNILEKMIIGSHNMDITAYNRYKKFTKNTKRIKRDYNCNVCHLQLSSSLTYDRHMQKHYGCRFMCEGCAKSFPTKSELNVHQVATHGIGPYLQCNHCPFKTARKVTLIEHIRLHTGERPYTCEKCGLTFRRKAIYRKHLIYHDEKNFQCPRCPRKFYRHCAMLAHMNNIHERMYLYMCNKCGVTYTKTMTVRRHLSEKHGIPREMQGKIIKVRKGSNTELPIK